MIVLSDRDVRFCTNCLACYKDIDAEIAACPIDDDVAAILQSIRSADGVIFSSPVHCGFVSGIMVAFCERATWTLLRPTGEFPELGLKGAPEPRLTDKPRATATIVSAGGVPPEMREACDMGTPWLAEMSAVLCNGQCIGDVYAGAVFTKQLAGGEWNRAYLFRELTAEQLQEAHDLGAKMARMINAGV